MLEINPISLSVLTKREQDIAKLLLCGLPNIAIANVLEISPRTVKSYLREMALKAGLPRVNRVKLIMALLGK